MHVDAGDTEYEREPQEGEYASLNDKAADSMLFVDIAKVVRNKAVTSSLRKQRGEYNVDEDTQCDNPIHTKQY